MASRHEVIGRGHAEWLVPWIADLISTSKVDRIFTGCGPGSFTGVRVAIAAARGLGLAWQIPVLGLNSLALIAAAATTDGERLVAIEGGHGELFLQSFGENGDEGPLLSLTPEGGGARFTQDIVIGSGAERLVSARGYGTAFAEEANAANLFKVAPQHRSLPPTPVYGRAPDAKPSAP